MLNSSTKLLFHFFQKYSTEIKILIFLNINLYYEIKIIYRVTGNLIEKKINIKKYYCIINKFVF